MVALKRVKLGANDKDGVGGMIINSLCDGYSYGVEGSCSCFHPIFPLRSSFR